MPMIRSRYPQDWNIIAQRVKEEAGWKCEQCGKPCRPKGVPWLEFAYRLLDEGWFLDLDKPQVFTLTVAHQDQNPANNDRSNLKAFCAPCHLKFDAPHRRSNSRKKNEYLGQMSLLAEKQ